MQNEFHPTGKPVGYRSSLYLFTLQQGITENQMKEMEAENVVLVVPKDYIAAYPKHVRKSILTLEQFIRLVKETEARYGCDAS